MSGVRSSDLVCPVCDGPVRAVGLKTVKHLLDYPQSRAVAGEGWQFCADPECDVYYFRVPEGSAGGGTGAGGVGAEGAGAHAPEWPADAVASGSGASGSSGSEKSPDLEVFRAADIKARARPHARGAERLVCYCFGHTAGDIAADARSGRHEIPAAIAIEVRAGMCACEVLNPGGG